MHFKTVIRLLQVFFTCVLSTTAIAQSRFLLMLSIGTIRHYPTSKSENGRIEGLPAWDVLPEIKLGYCINPKTQIEFGGQNPSLTSNFSINQTSSLEESFVSSKVLQSRSGYFKFFLNYKLKIKEIHKFSFSSFAGPSIIINRFTGLDYGSTVSTSSSYTNGLNIYYHYDYAVYKTKLYGFGLQAGIEIAYKKSATSAYVMSLAYHRGFTNFNEIVIRSYMYNGLIDQGKVLYSGTGLLLTLGYRF
jgi:hypothetical protein